MKINTTILANNIDGNGSTRIPKHGIGSGQGVSPANYSLLHCAHKKHIHQYLTGLRETYRGNMKHFNMKKLHITENFTINCYQMTTNLQLHNMHPIVNLFHTVHKNNNIDFVAASSIVL